MRDRVSGSQTQRLHEQVARTARPIGAIEDAARLAAGSNDILHRLVFGRRRHHERNVGQPADRDEILRHAVWQFGISGRHHHLRGGIHQERVAIGVGFGGHRRAERRAGAAAVLEYEILADLLADLFEHDAAGDVGGAAGGERHHDLDRLLGGPILGQRSDRRERQQRGQNRDRQADHFTFSFARSAVVRPSRLGPWPGAWFRRAAASARRNCMAGSDSRAGGRGSRPRHRGRRRANRAGKK